MRRFYIVLLMFLLCFGAQAQEFKCNVQVLTQAIQSSDKRIYQTLQTAIYEFMNNRRWTADLFQPNERIEFSMIINITEAVSVDEFKATAQIISTRPVFGSGYTTPILNLNDGDWQFKYVENEPLEFSDNATNSNLSSLLAYYAYLVLAYDYDTFSLSGGTTLFQKAQTIVNNCQNLNTKGWKAFENTKNRYWMVENNLNPIFKPLREVMYRYHRLGLDAMTSSLDNGRDVIRDCIPNLQKVFRERANSIAMKLFFTAKADEMVNVFGKANPGDRQKIVAGLSEVDPTNISKYQNIMKGQ